MSNTPVYPLARPRRLRLSSNLRRMVRETELNPADFITPLFVRHGEGIKQEIVSMPGVYQWSPDRPPARSRSNRLPRLA